MLCHAVQHRRLPEGKEESMFFYYFDRYYWILIVPALLFAIWAQSRVSTTYRKYSQVRSARGMTAAQVCRQILDENGLFQIRIERVAGNLTDHYDPRANVIRLSDTVYNSTSVAAIGVAAHEAGHAVQYAVGYVPIRIRSAVIPIIYRLKGSTLLGHDPADPLKQPVEAEKIKDFYQKWYTPDAMTLLVVGNVDARSVVDQINKTFGELKGKRETPAPVPTLSPLRAEAVSIMTDAVRQDRLSIMWDTPWQPIRESAALLRYWRADLAREALFWHVQQALSASNSKDIGLGFDCRVLYLRAQCAINIESPNDKLSSNLNLVARELAKVRDKGLPEEEFNALVAQKKLELQKLFAAYARADTDILMGQRMRSLQNQVVDIAPEQYQKLRQDFLNSLTVEMLNQDLRQQLSNDMALILLQPKGEPEFNMKALQAAWDQIMTPSTAAATTSVATDDVHPEVTDIPPAQ